jgi:hypothetical protein
MVYAHRLNAKAQGLEDALNHERAVAAQTLEAKELEITVLKNVSKTEAVTQRVVTRVVERVRNEEGAQEKVPPAIVSHWVNGINSLRNRGGDGPEDQPGPDIADMRSSGVT